MLFVQCVPSILSFFLSLLSSALTSHKKKLTKDHASDQHI